MQGRGRDGGRAPGGGWGVVACPRQGHLVMQMVRLDKYPLFSCLNQIISYAKDQGSHLIVTQSLRQKHKLCPSVWLRLPADTDMFFPCRWPLKTQLVFISFKD